MDRGSGRRIHSKYADGTILQLLSTVTAAKYAYEPLITSWTIMAFIGAHAALSVPVHTTLYILVMLNILLTQHK